MPKMPAKPDSRQIHVTLPAGMRALFNQLVRRNLYGDENSAVARHLITIGLDHLVEQRRLIDLPSLPAAEPEAVNEDQEEPETE